MQLEADPTVNWDNYRKTSQTGQNRNSVKTDDLDKVNVLKLC